MMPTHVVKCVRNFISADEDACCQATGIFILSKRGVPTMMIIRIKKIKDFTIYGLLFMAALNFQAKFFYFVFASLLLLYILQRKLIVAPESLFYLFLGVFMAVSNFFEGALSMIRCLAWVSFYWVGYNLVVARITRYQTRIDYDPVVAEKSGFSILAIVSFGSFTHYVMNFIYNFSDSGSRNTNDIWTGKAMAATGQAALACVMCGFAVALIFAPRKKSQRILGVALIIAIMAYNLILACRSLLMIILILLIIGVLYLVKVKKTAYIRFKLFIVLSLIILILATLFTMNIFNIQDILLDSNLFERFNSGEVDSVSDTGRWYAKINFIKNGYRYPWGGLHLREQYGYAHDLWLDGYDEYGLLGFLFLAVITLLGIMELIKLVRKTQYSREFKLTVCCVYVAILIEFCVEPILEGMPWLFACFCLVNGCVTGMNIAYQKNNGVRHENIADKYRLRQG